MSRFTPALLSQMGIVWAFVLTALLTSCKEETLEDKLAGRVIRGVYYMSGEGSPSFGFILHFQKHGGSCLFFGNPGRRLYSPDIDTNASLCFKPDETYVERGRLETASAFNQDVGKVLSYETYYKAHNTQIGDNIRIEFSKCFRQPGADFKCNRWSVFAVTVQKEHCDIKVDIDRPIRETMCEIYSDS